MEVDVGMVVVGGRKKRGKKIKRHTIPYLPSTLVGLDSLFTQLSCLINATITSGGVPASHCRTCLEITNIDCLWVVRLHTIMRLINTTTLELETFSDEPFELSFPRYAILSHTWEDEEVTFQDIQNLDVARKKRGYAKIAKCCETALEEGLQWAWIDTCCINKERSAELDEGEQGHPLRSFGLCSSH